MSEVQRGDTGIVRTVVRNNELTTFTITMLAVVPGAGPIGTDAIIGRTSGQVIDELGGIALGMSGSPAIINNKIIGAVAFGFLNDLTLAQITPLEAMLAVRPGEATVEGSTGAPAGEPLRLPLACGGLHSKLALDHLEQRLDRKVVPSLLTGAELKPSPDLVPGSSVAVALVLGDVEIGAIGTATFIEGDLVWAFGHSFLFRGRVEYPFLTAPVFETTRGHVPLPPFKIATMGDLIGTVLEDRATAVVAQLGVRPSLIPVDFTVTDLDRNTTETVSVEMVRDEALLTDLVLAVGVEAHERGLNRSGEGTALIAFTIQTRELGPVTRTDAIFDPENIGLASVLPLVELLTTLIANPFDPVTIERITFSSQVTAGRRTAVLVSADLPGGRVIKAGKEFIVEATIKPFGQPSLTIATALAAPVDQTGPVDILVLPGRRANPPGAATVPPAGNDLVIQLLLPHAEAPFIEVRQPTDFVLEGEPVRLGARVKSTWPGKRRM